ncbi:MAG: Ig-like domain-containing protein [Methanotrichaceae archaeon]|nr:Ig-like domain-containing protein [Methanotrichaceae archaeon]
MRRKTALILFLFLLACDVSDAHRMMMGYKVNELQVTALYDDGTPAQGAEIEVQSDGKTVAEGVTDENGTYTFTPDSGTGEVTFISQSTGHRAELTLNLEQKRQEDEVSMPWRAAAGLGYLLGIAGLAMIYVSRKG